MTLPDAPRAPERPLPERQPGGGRRRFLTHDRAVVLLALLAALPALVVALALLWGDDHSAKVRWTLTTLVVVTWLVVVTLVSCFQVVVPALHTL